MSDADLISAARAAFGAQLPSADGEVIPLEPVPGEGPGHYLPLDGPIVGRLPGGHFVYLRGYPDTDEEGRETYHQWAVSPLPA